MQEIAGYTAKQANTGDQIINLMVEATKKEGSISSMVFYTHGTGQGLILDDNQGLYSQGWDFGNANSANVFDIKAKVGSGEIKFTDDAIVIFASCNALKTLDDGLLSIAESFREQLGVTVIASNGLVDPEETKDGKETGSSVSRGTFLRMGTSKTKVVSIPGDDGSAKSEKKESVVERIDLGKKIDPAKITN